MRHFFEMPPAGHRRGVCGRPAFGIWAAPCGERLRGPAPKIPASLFKKGLTQNLVFPCEFGLANFFQMRYNKDMARNCALAQSGSIRKWQLRGAVLASRPSKRLHIVNRAPYATASCTAPLLYNIFQCFARGETRCGGRHVNSAACGAHHMPCFCCFRKAWGSAEEGNFGEKV